MREIKLEAEVAAPVDAVWEVYTDHVGWQKWAGVREVVLRRPGDPAPNGVGAARVMRSSGVAIEEVVTQFEPPHKLAYRLVGGVPVRNYTGEVTFEPVGENTQLVWRVSFEPLVPFTGALLERAIRSSLQGVLDRFVTYPFERIEKPSRRSAEVSTSS